MLLLGLGKYTGYSKKKVFFEDKLMTTIRLISAAEIVRLVITQGSSDCSGFRDDRFSTSK